MTTTSIRTGTEYQESYTQIVRDIAAGGGGFYGKEVRVGDEEVSVFVAQNTTEQSVDITYYGSIDGTVWYKVDEATLTDGTTIAGPTEALISLTDPWPLIKAYIVFADDPTQGGLTLQWAARRSRLNVV